MVLSTLLLLPALAHAIPDPQSHEPGPGGCAEGWVDAFVLGMGCLYLLQEPLPWEDAGNTCKSLGGQLVEIDNEEQLAFLQQGLNFADGAHWTTAHYWWTAANDKTLEGDWVWANSNTAVDSFLWSESQPDNCEPNHNQDIPGPCSAVENCGALYSSCTNGCMDVWMELYDLPCGNSYVAGYHSSPTFSIFTVCQIK